jgi:hypothetical protein
MTVVGCSTVLRDLVDSCEGPQDASSDKVNDMKMSSKGNLSALKYLEIPLNDTEDEVKTLMEHLHHPDRFWDAVAPVMTKEGVAKILHLLPI